MYNIKVKSLLPELYAQLDALAEKKAFENRNVYVFGKAIWGYAVTVYLQQKGIHVCGVVDNNAKEGMFNATAYLSIDAQLKEEVAIKFPEELLGGNRFDADALILISNKFLKSQTEQLRGLGYTDYNIAVIEKGDPVRVDTDFTEEDRVPTDRIKKELFELLQYLKKICEENHLTYYLTEGTLLGAVRHKGFIPWDDDIDLSMPLEDYIKLNEIFKEINGQNGRYALYSMLLDDDCVYAYSKVVNTQSLLYLNKYPMSLASHINIDIFPLSGVPLYDEAEYKRFSNDLNNFNSKWMKYRSYYGTGQYAFPDCKKEWYDLLTRYDYSTSKGISYIFAEGKNFRLCDRSLYNGVTEAEFEGEKFPIISGWDEYLKIAYGDYMKMPDGWQRYGKHSYLDCWRKED